MIFYPQTKPLICWYTGIELYKGGGDVEYPHKMLLTNSREHFVSKSSVLFERLGINESHKTQYYNIVNCSRYVNSVLNNVPVFVKHRFKILCQNENFDELKGAKNKIKILVWKAVKDCGFENRRADSFNTGRVVAREYFFLRSKYPIFFQPERWERIVRETNRIKTMDTNLVAA